jgi:hypothetical protein
MSLPPKKLTKAQLEAELHLCRTTCRNHWLGRAFVSTSKAGMWIGIAFFCYLSIQSMAGKETNARIDVQAHAGVSGSSAAGKADKEAEATDNQAQAARLPGSDPFLPNGWANVLCLIVGVGGLVYGRMQANFRRTILERYHPGMVAMERQIDPDRSSSDLPTRGGTRPEDA